MSYLCLAVRDDDIGDNDQPRQPQLISGLRRFGPDGIREARCSLHLRCRKIASTDAQALATCRSAPSGGQHEGAVVDPDGNVIRFGSPMTRHDCTTRQPRRPPSSVDKRNAKSAPPARTADMRSLYSPAVCPPLHEHPINNRWIINLIHQARPKDDSSWMITIIHEHVPETARRLCLSFNGFGHVFGPGASRNPAACVLRSSYLRSRL